jgi:NhaP-type Na+/H+ or K+/H+ antiporter
MALLAGSLVIVTGPTVIAPLLKRIRIQPRLYHILQWEGVMIDAVGVFIALLCFEWVTAQSHGASDALRNFGVRSVIGMTFGMAGGWPSISHSNGGSPPTTWSTVSHSRWPCSFSD